MKKCLLGLSLSFCLVFSTSFLCQGAYIPSDQQSGEAQQRAEGFDDDGFWVDNPTRTDDPTDLDERKKKIRDGLESIKAQELDEEAEKTIKEIIKKLEELLSQLDEEKTKSEKEDILDKSEELLEKIREFLDRLEKKKENSKEGDRDEGDQESLEDFLRNKDNYPYVTPAPGSYNPDKGDESNSKFDHPSVPDSDEYVTNSQGGKINVTQLDKAMKTLQKLQLALDHNKTLEPDTRKFLTNESCMARSAATIHAFMKNPENGKDPRQLAQYTPRHSALPNALKDIGFNKTWGGNKKISQALSDFFGNVVLEKGDTVIIPGHIFVVDGDEDTDQQSNRDALMKSLQAAGYSDGRLGIYTWTGSPRTGPHRTDVAFRQETMEDVVKWVAEDNSANNPKIRQALLYEKNVFPFPIHAVSSMPFPPELSEMLKGIVKLFFPAGFNISHS